MGHPGRKPRHGGWMGDGGVYTRRMKLSGWVAGLVVVGLASTACGQKRAMRFEDLMAMKRVSDPQVSPSGKWVMFSVTDVSLEKNTKVNHLWVVPIAGGGERQVTSGEGEGNGRFLPDGKSVSVTMKDQIYVMPWDEGAGTVGAPVQVSRVSGGADGAVWSPDSKRFLLTAMVYPECSVIEGDRGDSPTHRDTTVMNGAPSFVGMQAAGWAEEDACDKAKDEAADKSQVKAQLWTGLLYRHWNAYTGVKRTHILVMDADGGGVRDLTPASVVGDAETPTFSLGGPLGYAWAPDAKEMAYVTNLDKVPAASTNNDVFTLRLDELGAKAVKVSTSLGSDDGPSYSPDGKWLAFRSQARAGYESDRFRLMVMDRKSKSTRELMSRAIPKDGPMMGVPAFDLWIDEFIWTRDSRSFLSVSGEKGEATLYRLNVEGTDLHRLGKTVGEWSSIAETPDQAIVGSLMRVNRPTEIAYTNQQDVDDTTRTFNLDFAKPSKVDLTSFKRPAEETTQKTVEPRWLTRMNEGVLNQLNLDSMQSYWFAGAMGARVQGFIVRPPNFDSKKKYPVKFLIHGGPQGAWGDAWSYRWNAELMAASGYVVVMVNPRGSTGYGQAFIDGVNGDWGGKAYVDLMKGLDAAEAQFPFIDKDRECALGASYGGFMANWVLTHTNRFKCIVSHDGMYNPAAAYGTTEEMWFNEWEFRRPGANEPGQPWKYAGEPEADDPFRKWSPMLHIQDAKTPTLVIHSQKDYRLDVSEGFQLFTALQRLGVPSEMLYFPDEGHWVQKPQNSQLWNKTVSDWCDKWTHTNAFAAGAAAPASGK